MLRQTIAKEVTTMTAIKQLIHKIVLILHTHQWENEDDLIPYRRCRYLGCKATERLSPPSGWDL